MSMYLMHVFIYSLFSNRNYKCKMKCFCAHYLGRKLNNFWHAKKIGLHSFSILLICTSFNVRTIENNKMLWKYLYKSYFWYQNIFAQTKKKIIWICQNVHIFSSCNKSFTNSNTRLGKHENYRIFLNKRLFSS